MTIRLFVSDLDGTLVDPDKELTPGTIAAVARLRAAGVKFTVISARPMSGVMPLLGPLALDGTVAAFNGGILFRRDGTILSRHTVPADVAQGVVRLARETPAAIWVFADDRWYATDGTGAHTDGERVSAAQEPVVVDDIATVIDRADKITFVDDDAPRLHALWERCHAAFGTQATIAQSQTYYLDVTAPAANKGDGLAALALANDVPLDAVAAIGDQANDLPMLARAGLAIAMGNAPDAVKSRAGHVTLSNDRDGVAHAIDTLILGSE
ncbi:Cof-type HAD-IIB family hydrolase [Sphingomonas sp. Leaf412]|uniref:Cof-type HAD-IIB family hydrolase n=1 Tax=Sphingomonas sp. Leaf412 TaxID=1736370 RepID=UPI000A3EE2F7|nr:Cof-type HAD-IIB family hydrolase [Sphingomonas sp. Leaf412]